MKLIFIVVVTVLANSRCGLAQDYVKSAQTLQNSYRAKHGSAPLALDNNLIDAAVKCATYYTKTGNPGAHDCPYKNGAGENIIVGSTDWSLPDLTRAGIKMFYDEIKDYKFDAPGFGQNTGHFTQLVWKSSSTFGLGYASSPSGAVYGVVLYSPAGNVDGGYQKNVLPQV